MKHKWSFLIILLILAGLFVGCSEDSSVKEDKHIKFSTAMEPESIENESVVTDVVEEKSDDVSDTHEDSEEPALAETDIKSDTDGSNNEVMEEPKLAYSFTDLSKVMYAKQTANVRDLPNKTGSKVGSLSGGQEIIVTGQCNETSWYRIDLNGADAYVSNTLLSDEKPVAEEPPKQETANANTTTDRADASSGNSNVGTADNGSAGSGGNSGSEPTVVVPSTGDTVGNLVWVPTNGGKKYHSKSNCSKMKDPIQVTKEHAEANGYTPCKKCY